MGPLSPYICSTSKFAPFQEQNNCKITTYSRKSSISLLIIHLSRISRKMQRLKQAWRACRACSRKINMIIAEGLTFVSAASARVARTILASIFFHLSNTQWRSRCKDNGVKIIPTYFLHDTRWITSRLRALPFKRLPARISIVNEKKMALDLQPRWRASSKMVLPAFPVLPNFSRLFCRHSSEPRIIYETLKMLMKWISQNDSRSRGTKIQSRSTVLAVYASLDPVDRSSGGARPDRVIEFAALYRHIVSQ